MLHRALPPADYERRMPLFFLGTPYYTEAEMVIECKTMYAAPFDPQYFKSEAPKRMYSNFPAGIHTMYIGEVVNAWKK